MLRKGDIRVCPETNAELLIRWSEVRVLPPQPAAVCEMMRTPATVEEPLIGALLENRENFSAPA
jgi:hypothetical protein